MGNRENKFEQENKPKVFSRSIGEGGYTFLRRVLGECLDTGQPVVINSGKNYLRYEYQPGQKNFMEGVTVLEGSDEPSLKAFREVAESYKVEQGIKELKEKQ
jgi:hypothetical protein